MHVPGKYSLTVVCVRDGGGGSGKSLCLSQVVHWAARSGWLVIQVPSSKPQLLYIFATVHLLCCHINSFPFVENVVTHTLLCGGRLEWRFSITVQRNRMKF